MLNAAAMLALLVPGPARAEVAVSTTSAGVPMRVEALPLAFHPRPGGEGNVDEVTFRAVLEAAAETMSTATESDLELLVAEEPGGEATFEDRTFSVGFDLEHPDGPLPAGTLGLTYVTAVVDTGEIVDADISINGRLYTWSTTGEPDLPDLQSTLTHEIGHAIGLAHLGPLYPHAVMYERDEPGSLDKRTPEPEDERNIRYLYAPDGMEQEAVLGCSTPPRTASHAATLLAALGLLAAARRRQAPVRLRRNPRGATEGR